MQLKGLRWESNSRPRESSAALCQLAVAGSMLGVFLAELYVRTLSLIDTLIVITLNIKMQKYIIYFVFSVSWEFKASKMKKFQC